MSVIQQSGVIPYRVRDGNLEVLLITSSSGKRWIIPKGWVAPWMTSASSAAKEAWEEAGITGTVVMPAIGSYHTHKLGYSCPVEVFLMSVETEQDNYPEAERRKRQWMSLSKAVKRVQETELQQLFEQVHQMDLEQSQTAPNIS